jgi:hypothetical protein
MKKKLLTQIIRLATGIAFVAAHYCLLSIPAKFIWGGFYQLYIVLLIIVLVVVGSKRRGNIFYGVIYGIGLIASFPLLYLLIGGCAAIYSMLAQM